MSADGVGVASLPDPTPHLTQKSHSSRAVACNLQVLRASRRGPWQQHDLAAEPANIDAGMDITRGSEWQAVDNDRMDGALAQEGEQRGHVGFEFFEMRRPASGDAVPTRTAAAEEDAH